MTERKPRVAITLSDETRAIMQRLAELEGTQITKVVASIVESFAPTAKELADAMDKAKQLPEEKRRQLAAAINEIEPELVAKTSAAQNAFTEALSTVENLK